MDTLYESDPILWIKGNPYQSISLYDEQGRILCSTSFQGSDEYQPIVLPYFQGGYLTITAQEEGKRPVSIRVAVQKNVGWTEKATLVTPVVYPGIKEIRLAVSAGDIASFSYKGYTFIAYSGNTTGASFFLGNFNEFKTGDKITIQVKSRGKQPSYLTFTVKEAP